MPGFSKVIQDAWADTVIGTPMFRVITKLRRVKKLIIEWRRTQLPISSKVQEARNSLAIIQQHMTNDMANISLQEAERTARASLDFFL